MYKKRFILNAFFVFFVVVGGVFGLDVVPGEDGFGMNTPAGRGGDIYTVTNLNPSGSGSLKECVDASGSRICVFEVSGTIVLTDHLKITNPYITIAGQTAPSPGITIRGAGLQVQASDVLVQHIRVRVGDSSDGPAYDSRDAVAIGANYDPVDNVVIDHVSASWAIDEVFSAWSYGSTVNDVSVINSIFAEGLYDSVHPDGAHSMGALIGKNVDHLYFGKNIMAYNNYRNPLIRDDVTDIVVANNYLYNPGVGSKSTIYFGSKGSGDVDLRATVVGNDYYPNPDEYYYNTIYVQNDAPSNIQIYLEDNGGPLSSSDPWSVAMGRIDSSVRASSEPVSVSGLSYLEVGDVKGTLFDVGGARPADRDAVDERLISSMNSHSGTIIDSQDDVGGWPTLDINRREVIIPSNPDGDDDGDGYTNMEEILHAYSYWVEEDILHHPQYETSVFYNSVELDNTFDLSTGLSSTFADLNAIYMDNGISSGDIAIMHDSDYIHIMAEISDSHLSSQNDVWSSDGLKIVFDTGSDVRKIFVDINGNSAAQIYVDGAWVDWNANVEMGIFPDGTVDDGSDTDVGYQMKIKIPWSELELPVNSFNGIGFDINLRDRDLDGVLSDDGWSNSDGGDFNNVEGFGYLKLSSDAVVLDGEGEDTTSPVILSVIPTGEVAAGTTDVTLTVQTDEIAYCHFDDEPDVHYLDMSFIFENTVSKTHTHVLSGLVDGGDYTYYVKCRDTAPSINYMMEDYVVSFNVAELSQATQTTDTSTQTDSSVDRSSSSSSSSKSSTSRSSSITSYTPPSDTTQTNEEEVFSVLDSEQQENVCIPDYTYGEWSACINSERERLVIDLNRCFNETVERSFCSVENDEIGNQFMNAKDIVLEETEIDNIYKTILKGSYNQIFVSDRDLRGTGSASDPVSDLIVIIDEKTGQEYLARMVDSDEENDLFYYSLERIDMNSIDELKDEGIVKKSKAELIGDNIDDLLTSALLEDFLKDTTMFLIPGGLFVYARSHVRRKFYDRHSHNLHVKHFEILNQDKFKKL